jgi:hypothetical protein
MRDEEQRRHGLAPSKRSSGRAQSTSLKLPPPNGMRAGWISDEDRGNFPVIVPVRPERWYQVGEDRMVRCEFAAPSFSCRIPTGVLRQQYLCQKAGLSEAFDQRNIFRFQSGSVPVE